MSKDASTSTTWTISQLVGAVQGSPQAPALIRIPKFQRSIVWKNEQRAALIESLLLGYPIGSILLFKTGEVEDKKDVYQVVDGLQRTSTLVRYEERPLNYTDPKRFSSIVRTELAGAFSINDELVVQTIAAWMSETRSLTFTAGYRPDRVVAYFETATGVSLDHDTRAKLNDSIGAALDQLKEEIDLKSVSVPIVVYSGSHENLPDIFERINQSGTKLNKYEVFAATWMNNAATLISNDAVREAVNGKYQALITQGFGIDGLENDGIITDYNLFEYLFGLGKVLVAKVPLLFGGVGGPTDTEPAAFSLACVVLGRQLSAMDRLNSFMPRDSSGLIAPEALEAAVLEAAAAVQKWLEPHIGLRLNRDGDGPFIAHGELQIVSMIARAVVGKWDTRGDWSERPNWRSDWAALERAVPVHYLLDVLEATWRGPIYSMVFSRVWDTDESGRILGPSKIYSTSPSVATVGPVLDAWYARELSKEQRSRPNLRTPTLLFLRYLYSDVVSYKENKKLKFEVEHLFPVARLRQAIEAEGASGGWPISCVANLALFTKPLNREKQALTISEYFEQKNPSKEERAMVEKLLLCDVDDVTIPEGGLKRADYEYFMENRWDQLKVTLYAALALPSA